MTDWTRTNGNKLSMNGNGTQKKINKLAVDGDHLESRERGDARRVSDESDYINEGRLD